MALLQTRLFLKHDVRALQDEKIIMLDLKFSHLGYSVFWRLLEYMFQTENCEIDFKQLEIVSERVLATKVEDVKAVLNYCLEIGLFVTNEDKTAFYSKRLKAQRAEIEEMSQKQRARANRRWNKEIPQKSNAPAMPRQCGGNANKKKKNNQNKTETQTQKQTEDASTSAPTAAEKPPDYSPELRKLSDEIAAKFGYANGRKFDRQVATLIHDLHPGDGFQAIPEALKKLDSAQAILAGKVTFTIGSFLDYNKFLRLFSGDYDDLYTR